MYRCQNTATNFRCLCDGQQLAHRNSVFRNDLGIRTLQSPNANDPRAENNARVAVNCRKSARRVAVELDSIDITSPHSTHFRNRRPIRSMCHYHSMSRLCSSWRHIRRHPPCRTRTQERSRDNLHSCSQSSMHTDQAQRTLVRRFPPKWRTQLSFQRRTQQRQSRNFS